MDPSPFGSNYMTKDHLAYWLKTYSLPLHGFADLRRQPYMLHYPRLWIKWAGEPKIRYMPLCRYFLH